VEGQRIVKREEAKEAEGFWQKLGFGNGGEDEVGAD
jgi:hypothetical protein